AVCSEDATAVIKKVTYNAATNTFTGFSLPLERGIPVARHFQTDSFDELNNWFENEDKTDYLNVHIVQPLIASSPYSSPFLLAAYGISNNFKAIDVLNRWIWIFEKSKQSNVRIVAFSTDCDPRYLLAMRLATGFFAKFVNISLCDRKDVLDIDLPKDWSARFFMQTRQVFFCFQDPTHLCTKLRNRMLSKKATMLIGNEVVSIEVTYDEGESYSSNDESDKELETNVNSSSTSGDDSSEDENDLPGISSSGKHQFNGMRVTDTISPSLTNS
ncbi:unnamed protein product, partial [Rotaria socialis]